MLLYTLSTVTVYDLFFLLLPHSNNSTSLLIHATFELNFVFPGFLAQPLLSTIFSGVIIYRLSLSVSVINYVFLYYVVHSRFPFFSR